MTNKIKAILAGVATLILAISFLSNDIKQANANIAYYTFTDEPVEMEAPSPYGTPSVSAEDYARQQDLKGTEYSSFYEEEYQDKWLITSLYGDRTDPFDEHKTETHKGIDIDLTVHNDHPMLTAVIGGTALLYEGDDSTRYMKTLEIEGDDGYSYTYSHMAGFLVEDGARVESGDIIGIQGNSGRSTLSHLHFGIWLDGVALDPMEVRADWFTNDKLIDELK